MDFLEFAGLTVGVSALLLVAHPHSDSPSPRQSRCGAKTTPSQLRHCEGSFDRVAAGGLLLRQAVSEGTGSSFRASQTNSGQFSRFGPFSQVPRSRWAAPRFVPPWFAAVWPRSPGAWASPWPTGPLNAINVGPADLDLSRAVRPGAAAIAPSLEICTLTRKGPDQSPRPFMQVRLGNSPIGQMPNVALAETFARQIQQAMQDPDFAADQIQLTQVDGMPAGKMGDRILFTIPRDRSQSWTCNADQLAIQWINRLRLVQGKAPLAFVQAQTALYDLRETPQRLRLKASWYGPYFHGRQTATGETFNQHELTAAHPVLPFDTYLKVTNQRNGKSVIVRINDRGPYAGDRNLDLSWEAARAIGSETDGVVALDAVIMQPNAMPQRSSLEIAHL